VRLSFFAPWDFPSLGQTATSQFVLDEFIMCKFRTFRVAEAATPLRHVLVRNPSSKVNGLDLRLARESLHKVVAYIARLEVGGQLSTDAPPLLSRLKRPRLSSPPGQADAAGGFVVAPAVVPPLPAGGVPAHLLTVTKSHRAHRRRDATRRRFREAAKEKLANQVQDLATGTMTSVLPHSSDPLTGRSEAAAGRFQTLDLVEAPDWNDVATQ